MKPNTTLIGKHRHWKCPQRGCRHIARTRTYQVCPAGHLHPHLPSECPAHEVPMTSCAADEFHARTTVH